MRKAGSVAACAAVAAGLVGAIGAEGAGPPPPPKAPGKTVALVASGVPTPTAFAFAGGTVFVAGAGAENGKGPKGGVFVVKAGKAVRIPGSPPFVAGLAWHYGTLYVSAGRALLAWSGGNGRSFAHHRTIVAEPAPFSGFSGLAVGPDGWIYTGVMLGQGKQADHSAGTTPYANDFLRIDPRNGDIGVVATGLRQPWQATFVTGSADPIVSVLGQENLGKTQPPDYLVRATRGARFGFPVCNWSSAAACAGYTRPLAFFPAHSSPMGLGTIGHELYVALFAEGGKRPEIVRLSTSGGSWHPYATGYHAPVVALGTHGNAVYTGDLSGSIYRIG
jgi:glucose/arabinose dehydrogenase